MATRMQQRRGTASQWTSANPVLNAGEMGWESDTNKFKIGDGTNHWADLDYFADTNSTVNPAFGTSITFEGATADSYETTLQVTDPTADRTITLPNVSGTVITTGNLSDITDIGVFASTITMEGSSADDYELTLSAGNPTADRTITFPNATGTVALTSDITGISASSTDTLTNKSISLASNTITSTLAQLNTAVTDADVASLAGSETLTNKTIALGSNTVSGTLADFNTAVTDADLASLAGSETLTNKTISFGSNTVSGTLAQFNTAVTDANLVSLEGSETLTNKTLTSPVITGAVFNDGSIVFEGATANDHETTFSITDPTADRTITFPDDSGTVAFTSALSSYATLSGATFTGAVSGTDLTLSGNLTVNGTTTNINSTNLVVEDKNIVLGDTESPSDAGADGGGITLKGTTDKTFNWVDATDSWTSSEHINLASGKAYSINGTALKDVNETLTNKTLTSPVISSISNTGTLTLPTSTDTLVGRATTDTLTNKTIALGSNTVSGSLSDFNTAVTDADLASLAGSETLTNKTISGANNTLTVRLANDVTGTLPVANGGTGITSLGTGIGTFLGTPSSANLASAVTDETGSGALVFGTSPSFTTAITLNATGELRLADTDSSNYVGFKSPATVSTNKIWTLPSADGTSGQVLSTDGSGILSWASAGGISASSTDTLTNKTINLTSNTLSGTIAQFNTALSDADFATLSGTETLANKTLTAPTITGTLTLPSTTSIGTVSDTEIGYLDGVTSAIQTQIDSKASYSSTINSQSGTTYTFVLDDHKKTVVTTSSSAVTLTIPQESSEAWPAGAILTIVQNGTGAVTVAAGAGVTLNTQGATGARKMRYQHQVASCFKTGTNTWMITGDLVTP